MAGLTEMQLCRSCGAPLTQVFADLGVSPPSNRYLRRDQLGEMEPFYPLRAMVCGRCWLVQLPAFQTPGEIFGDYAYFSSYSSSWLDHAAEFAARATERLSLGSESRVVEIASNDGYLLQYFQDRGIPVLGIEPAANVAETAIAKGVPTQVRFFGAETAASLASDGWSADLLVGNNVLAHVPDLNDFVAGLRLLLKPDGVLTMEFPHLLELMRGTQFDTIYHEHFSYLSLLAAECVFARHGIALFDVERLPTHGGSLRVWGCRAEHGRAVAGPRVEALRRLERDAGLDDPAAYSRFEAQVRAAKRSLLEFLIGARRQGKSIAGYGAPAKGNTLLNYCGVRSDLLDYTVDRSPHKQGLFLPGTHIPIHAPSMICETRPDYVLILPWNLRDEIAGQIAHIREWGGRFVVPIPTTQVLP
ncbi:MAG TPA: class I SAM-dependent methyltransferase [Chthonomonadaceae bacterium]|nr:class I SAM-dependent methyltransferase [Chthonomonadaceae bacterium]